MNTVIGLAAMDPLIAAIFYLVAVVMFLLAAFGAVTKPSLVALGLAVAWFPAFWNSAAAA